MINVGRIRDVSLKYLAIVKNPVLIENCIKLELKKERINSSKEIFGVTAESLKTVIDTCYAKHVSKKKMKN